MNDKFLTYGIFGLLIAAAGVTALLFVRLIPFNTSDVRVAIDAPRELDIGAKDDIFVTVFNGTRATLRDGSIVLDLPEGITLLESETTTFDELEPHEQITARFSIRASGDPGTLTEVIARAQFQPRQLSARFTKEETVNLLLRDLPFSINFSLPANIVPGIPTTFYLQAEAHTDSSIGPLGVELDVPFDFEVTRTRPEPTSEEGYQWDFGVIDGGFKQEIQITGIFPLDVDRATFSARIGLFDAGRFSLRSYREVEQTVTLRTSDITINLLINDNLTGREETIETSDIRKITVAFQNTTKDPIDDLTIEIAAAHDLIRQRNISASEPYNRSVSGEYIFTAPSIAFLNQIQPGGRGEISITFPIVSVAQMRTFSDANQSFTIRARALSGGRILGERSVELKLVGQLSIDAEVLYYKAPGGSNSGPLPPKVGQQTTYTTTLKISGGTSGIEDTTARLILAEGVTYLGSIDPTDPLADGVIWSSTTRELVWSLGALPPGAGIISEAKVYMFRLGFTPTASMVGKAATLLETITVAGRDVFVDRILDASDSPITSQLRDDKTMKSFEGVVALGFGSPVVVGDDENEKGE